MVASSLSDATKPMRAAKTAWKLSKGQSTTLARGNTDHAQVLYQVFSAVGVLVVEKNRLAPLRGNHHLPPALEQQLLLPSTAREL